MMERAVTVGDGQFARVELAKHRVDLTELGKNLIDQISCRAARHCEFEKTETKNSLPERDIAPVDTK